MRRAWAAAWLALLVPTMLALAACSRTRDLYVGSDFDRDEGQSGASGGSAPPTSQDAGTTGTNTGGAGRDTAAGAAGSAGAGGSGGAGGSAGTRSTLPPPVLVDAAVPPLACATGTADCDDDSDNGCETNLTSDPMNCGNCGLACPDADCMCVDGIRLDCPAGSANCDADATNGCETDLTTDAEHCGACGTSCTSGPGVASATCEDSVCKLACSLPNLLGDCDGDASNGCETDLFHDRNNCSECGMKCNTCVDARCL